MYDNFLSEMARGKIDLTEKNTYKVCLLKESTYADLMTSECNYNYSDISLAGMECIDSKGDEVTESYGYPEGGKYTFFTENSVSTYKYVDYFSDDIVFNNVDLEGDNAAKYALLYRESDGLIMSIYDLGDPVTVEDDSLILYWKGSPVMRIGSSSKSSLDIDDKLDANSSNAVSNRRIVEALKRYGLLLGDESYDDDDTDEDMDRISRLPDEDIENLFPSVDSSTEG